MRVIFTSIFFFLLSFSSFGQDSVSLNNRNENSISDTVIYYGKIDKLACIKDSISHAQFIKSHLSPKFFDYIIKKKIKGRFYVILTVNKKGEAMDYRVINGLDPYVSNEILNIIKKMQWNPAYAEGMPVTTRMSIPIVF
jgi:hypothetical protein